MTDFERRGMPVELRAKGRRLEGYAATFGTPADIGGRFIETIAPGAFTTPAGAFRSAGDVLALVDHDPSRVLARTRSRTLRLAVDSKGLAFDLDLPETQAGKDVLALAERGDLGGMSFAFTPLDEKIDGDRRELRAVYLHEISVVLAWPAYGGTVINLRSLASPSPFRPTRSGRCAFWSCPNEHHQSHPWPRNALVDQVGRSVPVGVVRLSRWLDGGLCRPVARQRHRRGTCLHRHRVPEPRGYAAELVPAQRQRRSGTRRGSSLVQRPA